MFGDVWGCLGIGGCSCIIDTPEVSMVVSRQLEVVLHIHVCARVLLVWLMAVCLGAGRCDMCINSYHLIETGGG